MQVAKSTVQATLEVRHDVHHDLHVDFVWHGSFDLFSDWRIKKSVRVVFLCYSSATVVLQCAIVVQTPIDCNPCKVLHSAVSCILAQCMHLLCKAWGYH